MSKLAHSNQETMDEIERRALADEKSGKTAKADKHEARALEEDAMREMGDERFTF